MAGPKQRGRRIYLSLGDSLSTGVQPIGPQERQFRTDDGFTDQLRRIAAETWLPDLEAVKLGYPGESTATMIDGSLCAHPHGSQLDEAVWYLRTYAEQVAFVTIDIGFNDFPGHDADALAPGLASIAANLPGILGRLREAAPAMQMLGMTIYDPFLASWLDGPAGRDFARQSLFEGIMPINDGLEALYRTQGFGVADVEDAFESADFDDLVEVDGIGGVPRNVARVLDWTWMGAPPPLGPDPHANVRGYRVIAESFAGLLRPAG